MNCIEVIPYFNCGKPLNRISVHTVCNTKSGEQNSSSRSAAALYFTTSNSMWNQIVMIHIPLLLMIAMVFSLKGLVMTWFASYEQSVTQGTATDRFWSIVHKNINLSFIDPLEIWAAFITWSWTNLFIRRRLNPEIGSKAFER